MAEPFEILVVEDDAPKLAHIEELIRSLAPHASIRTARSVNSAINALETRLPHLVLLDMSLPTFDIGRHEGGGRPQGFGGWEILRRMSLGQVECPTVVITGYEAFPREAGKPLELSQIRDELAAEFPSFFRGALHYNSTYDEWRRQLERVLRDQLT